LDTVRQCTAMADVPWPCGDIVWWACFPHIPHYRSFWVCLMLCLPGSVPSTTDSGEPWMRGTQAAMHWIWVVGNVLFMAAGLVRTLALPPMPQDLYLARHVEGNELVFLRHPAPCMHHGHWVH
jgi:hypothetical protein